jgi:tetratricopeptide (TPR) repeat protein
MGDEAYNDQVLIKYRDVCDKVIQEFNGHIEQYLGDGIVAYFGSPEAHEDDARNAVSSGLRIVENISRLEVPVDRVQVRVGIHSGLAFMSQGRAVGETPAVAARVQEAAQPATVLITEATRTQVAGFFHLEEQAARQLKGFSRTTRLYCVRGTKGVRSRLEAAATLGLTPLVGREQEGKFLLACWEKTKEGSGQTVLIRGEAGIGKSRAIEELKKHLAGEEYRLLEGYCSPYQQHTPFAPISDLLTGAMGIAAEDSPQEKLSKLNATMAELAATSKIGMSLIAQILSVPLSTDQPPLELTPIRQRQLTLEILMDWLSNKARDLPLLLVVEDLHWTDPSTLELLALIMSQQRGKRLMLVMSFRPEFSTLWPTHEGVHEIKLSGLLADQTAVLATHVAHNRTLPDQVVQEVVKRTDGVPLFVEEMTKMLLESGFLKGVNGSYELTGPLPSRAIPATVEGSVMARLDRFGPEKTLAQLGATLGREFSYDVLQAISQVSGEDLQAGLARLIDADLITQNGLPPRATYLFKHALIQDAVYESLSNSTRRQYHRRIAEVLEKDFPEVATTAPELLAQHFTTAGFNQKALDYWEKAGQRALERAANREAINHLELALQTLKSLPNTGEIPQIELRLQLLLMPAHMAIRGWASQEVEACCVRARELCIALNDHQHLFGALWGLWTVYLVRGELQEALVVAMQVLEMALAAGEKILEVMGHHAVGFTRYFRGELLEARRHAVEGIRLFELETEKHIVNAFQFSSTMALRFFLSASLWLLGSRKESEQELAKAATLIAVLKHAPSSAAFMAYKLCFYLYSRDTKTMRIAAAELIQLSEAEGFRLYVPVGMMYSGWALIADGEIDEGLKQIERGLTAYRATGSFIKYVEVMVMYAEALYKAGRIEDAVHALEEGMRHANTREEHLLESELYRIRGDIRLAQNRESDAAEDLDRAIEIARRQSAVALELRAVMSKCRFLQSQGKKHEAQWQLRKLYDSFTEGFYTKDLIEAKNLLDELSAP